MAYATLDESKPDPAADDGTEAFDNTRTNMLALRDAVVGGTFPGWDLTVTAGTGTAEQPQYYTYDKGTERVRSTLTWGTTPGTGAYGNVISVVYEYSSDGTNYDVMGDTGYPLGKLTISYDSDANVTGTAWL